MGWLDDAVNVVKTQPAVKFEKVPNVSVEPNVAIAVKCLSEPREKVVDEKTYLFMDVELLEAAVVYDKTKPEADRVYEAPTGTKCSINLARHSGLKRAITQNFLEKNIPLTGQEIVIANLGKKSFRTKAGKTAAGFEYRVDTVANIKAAIAAKQPTSKKK